MRKFQLILCMICTMMLGSNSIYAQWVQNPGPFGGSILDITASGTNLYAVTNAIIFHSSDEGTNWDLLNFPGKLFPKVAVIGANLIAVTNRDGVFLSKDNGTSWTQVNSSFNTNIQPVPLLVIGTNLLVGTSKGVFLSTDFGTNWVPSNNPILQDSRITVLSQNGTKLFAGTLTNGAFISIDNGVSWTQVNNGLDNLNINSFAFIGVNTFAGTDSSVFISDDDGTTWSEANTGLPTGSATIAVFGTSLFAWSNGSVYRSIDNGLSWQLDDTKPFFPIAVSDEHIFALSGKGISRSSDYGASWISANKGINMLTINEIFTFDSYIFAGGFRSQDNGINWEDVTSGINLHQMRISGTDLFGADTKGIFRSKDFGKNWTPSGLSDSLIAKILVYGSNLLVSTWTADYTAFETFISKDYGVNWSVPNGLSSKFANCSASLGSNLFVGTYYNGIYSSTDDGENWSPVNKGLQAGTIYALGTSGTNLYASVGYGSRTKIYESEDNGANWKDITYNLSAGSIFQILSSGNYLFVGCDKGIFYTSDKGENWTDANSGFGSYPANIYKLTIIGSELFAGTSQRGLWRRPLSEFDVNIVNESEAGIEIITLSPNPADKQTTINFALAEPCMISISVTNSLGIETSRIIDNQLQEAGNHSVNYDTGNLTPGVYFLTIQSGKNTETKKFVVVR